jgi:hypothetical protein
MDFPKNGAPMRVPTVHWNQGPGFTFDWTMPLNWFWQELIAQLDDESMKIVVEGEKRKSHGLIGCEIMIRPNSYDHKIAVQESAVAQENRDETLCVWDFIITRFDGSKIRLHPQRITPDVETFSAEGPTEQVPLPKKGHGQSDGPGTFRHFVNTQTQGNLKFDPKKGKGLSPYKKKN